MRQVACMQGRAQIPACHALHHLAALMGAQQILTPFRRLNVAGVPGLGDGDDLAAPQTGRVDDVVGIDRDIRPIS